MTWKAVAVLPTLALALPLGAGTGDEPSRAAVKGCTWQKLSDPKLGLEAWVQRCDFGFRKVEFLFKGSSLAIRYSDGGEPDPLVDVLELQADETPEAGIERLFKARTDPGVARRCVLAPYPGDKPPAGVKRLTFVPDAAYGKELEKTASPDEIPDPPCGEWGMAPDAIQYFEAQPSRRARKVLFVRLGQDEPLFDEKTLHLLP